jgi:hypothetical protein
VKEDSKYLVASGILIVFIVCMLQLEEREVRRGIFEERGTIISIKPTQPPGTMLVGVRLDSGGSEYGSVPFNKAKGLERGSKVNVSCSGVYKATYLYSLRVMSPKLSCDEITSVTSLGGGQQ